MKEGTRVRRHLFGAVLVLAVSFVSTGGGALHPAGATSSPTRACSATPASPPMGVYAGAAAPQGVADFATTTGARVTLASDYLPGNGGFAGMSDAQQLSWLLGPWQGSGCQLVLGVPMIPTDSNGNPAGTLANGAKGTYNSSFTTLAHTLVNAGFGNAVLRLGWEFDGAWFAWSVSNNTDAANFATYWQQIVTAMRAVAGANFKFDWNPSGGWISWNINDAYPGDAYVDYVGLDRYDQTWNSPQTPQVAWNDLTTMPDGMNWLAGFGSAHGKALTLPEWGVSLRSDGHGLGDDPYFVNQMASWIASNNVAFTSYLNADQAPGEYHALTDGQFPNALSTFEALFGGSASPGPTSPATTPMATSTALSLSPSAPMFGQTVSATATVSPNPSGGTVQMSVDGTAVGSPVAVAPSTGVAVASLSGLAPGSHQVTATYSGQGSSFEPSAATVALQVSPAPTNLAAARTSVTSSLLSRSVTMTATLTSAATNGAVAGQAVAFTANNGGGTCSATTSSSGAATCTVKLGLLSASPTSYSAAYAGDADYLASNGSAAVG